MSSEERLLAAAVNAMDAWREATDLPPIMWKYVHAKERATWVAVAKAAAKAMGHTDPAAPDPSPGAFEAHLRLSVAAGEAAECRACANKPGSPALCPACLHNRALVGLLQQRLAVAEARATANALERDYWLAFYDERGPKKQRVYRFKEAFKAMANARGKVGEEERKLAALTKARET
jgi:hypothetical protein